MLNVKKRQQLAAAAAAKASADNGEEKGLLDGVSALGSK